MVLRIAALVGGLPGAIQDKIGKTLQTRGAQPYDRVPYQNRVNRNGRAVVPYAFRDRMHPDGFESGSTIMVLPSDYFEGAGRPKADFDPAVVLGDNAFVYYNNRRDWVTYPVPTTWTPCPDRTGPGDYIARVPATTATDPAAAATIVRGEAQGIRFFEYASSEELAACVAQLTWLAWHTEGIETETTSTMPDALIDALRDNDLADTGRLAAVGAIQIRDGVSVTICPLCLERITARGLIDLLTQTQGREVVDLTVTEVNLFHLQDLKPGEYNHRRYLLGWGHHHCNTVARDRGVPWTVEWMRGVVARHDATNIPVPEVIEAETVEG